MQSSQSKHVADPEKKRGGAKWDGRTFLSLPKAFPVKSSGNAALNPQNRAFVPSKCDCLQEKYHQVMNFWNRGGPAWTGARQRPRDSSGRSGVCWPPWQLVPECWREISQALLLSPRLPRNPHPAVAKTRGYGFMQPDYLRIRKHNILLCICSLSFCVFLMITF